MCQPVDFTLCMSTNSSTISSDDGECFALVETTLSPRKSKKRVRFGTAAIVQFEVRIGDSIPIYGPPVGLGEAVVHRDVWCVNHYEAVRSPRRTLKQLKLDPWKRTRLLYRQGYDPETIARAACEADTIRANRKESSFDEEKPVKERPGLIRKGSKKLFRLTHRLPRLRLPQVSRFNMLNTRA